MVEGDVGRRAHPGPPAGRRQLAAQQPQQRRLAAAVRADDANPLEPPDLQVQAAKQRREAGVAEAAALQRGHVVRPAQPRLEVQLDHRQVVRRPRHAVDLVQPLLPALRLAHVPPAAQAQLPADPLLLALELAALGRIGLPLGRPPVGLDPQVVGVGAVVPAVHLGSELGVVGRRQLRVLGPEAVQRQLGLLQLGDRLHAVVEEPAVVADDDHAAGEAAQERLDPLGHLDVQVVGRLVEQQQVAARREDLGQRQPALLAARERGHRLVQLGRAEAQRAERGQQPLLEIEPAARLQLGQQPRLMRQPCLELRFAEAGLADRLAGRLELLGQPLHLAQHLARLVQHGVPQVEAGVLGQVADARAAGQGHRPAVGVVGAQDQAAEGRLAAAVDPHQAEPLAAFKA